MAEIKTKEKRDLPRAPLLEIQKQKIECEQREREREREREQCNRKEREGNSGLLARKGCSLGP